MCALQSKYINKSKRLAVYLIVSLWGTACTGVHLLAAGGMHVTEAMMGEQACVPSDGVVVVNGFQLSLPALFPLVNMAHLSQFQIFTRVRRKEVTTVINSVIYGCSHSAC